jgi:TQXA domain-containing protein
MFEPEVDWILRNSFPTLGTAELSDRLRAAGYPLGPANLAEHEAIAATQAAIWRFTNDLRLDNRPLDVPVAAHRDPEGVTFEFDGAPELGGYAAEVSTDVTARLVLQKSVDGVVWRDVAGSALAVAPGTGRYHRTLGVGSTVSRMRHGARTEGHRYYRLRVVAADPSRVTVGETSFRLTGGGTYRNSARVVHLYDYLLAGAGLARRRNQPPRLSAGDAAAADGLIGPLRLHATDSAALTVSHGAIVDADGRDVAWPVAPGTQFYLRPRPGRGRVTVTVAVPATPNGFGGRVITGVARDAANSRLTPVALAVPSRQVVEFDISWIAREGELHRGVRGHEHA